MKSQSLRQNFKAYCYHGLSGEELGTAFVLASHADVLRGSSRVPGAGTRGDPQRTQAWEATFVRELGG